MNRDVNLSALRPTIPTAEAIGLLESFQNQTLRPILKLQNDVVVLVFRHYAKKRKDEFYKQSPKEKLAYIEQAIKRDMKFKHYVTGLIVGHFTKEEFDVFYQNEEENTKRLINLLIQRLQSQVEAL